MITVSDSWKEIHKQSLLPETFVEIIIGVADVSAQDVLEVSGTDEAFFSNTDAVIKNVVANETKYATLEHNLWLLDGSRNIAPDAGPYNAPGYANNGHTAVIELIAPGVRTTPVPGFTITWSKEYGEYATDFAIEVMLNGETVGSISATGNTSDVTELEIAVAAYDRIKLTVTGWSFPNRRVRIDRIALGRSVTFAKNDILSFSHEQQGCLNSGEIPKNSIDFALNNTDGKWNPHNPEGIGKYMMERQTVTVRYGMDVNGNVEWVNAGKFYLSDWSAPSNGLEATFSARDAFEFLMNHEVKTAKAGTLTELANHAIGADFPTDLSLNIDPSLGEYTATYSGENTGAEIIQKCANAACCVVRCDREGNINIEPLKMVQRDYVVVSDLSYSHPELTLSKQLKEIAVSYGDDNTYPLTVGKSGEVQTVDNPFVSSEGQAAMVAEWVQKTLESRKTVAGEFRADPRLELFDIISVESKYGAISPVAITNIKYSYAGSFRGSYTGKVITPNKLGEFILGKSILG